MKRLAARKPLNSAELRQMALAYVGRYATSRAKLAGYLRRKLAERGWDEAGTPPVEAIVDAMVAQRFVDDRAFADMKGGGLARRGYGTRRVRQALQAAGIGEEDAADALRTSDEDKEAVALAYARRRRLGPFSSDPTNLAKREKALAAMLRAGHEYITARRILDLSPELVQSGMARSGL